LSSDKTTSIGRESKTTLSYSKPEQKVEAEAPTFLSTSAKTMMLCMHYPEQISHL
jgi:hypothetical protein